MFIDCQLPYSHSTDTDLWSLSWIHFSGVTMQTVYQKYQERGGRPVFKPDNFAGFQSLHQSLFDLAASDDYIRDMRINSGLNELLVFLMNESWHPAEHPDRARKKQNLLPVRNYLEAHYTEKIVLDKLADRFFYQQVPSFPCVQGAVRGQYPYLCPEPPYHKGQADAALYG